MDRIAVTGAGGFVGRALLRRLSDAGMPVRALLRTPADIALPGVETVAVGDLLRADLSGPLRGCGIVVNLAARVHVTRETEADPEAAFLRLNRDFPVALARAAHGAGVRRLVQMSSVAALCSVTPPDVVAGDDFPPRPANAYGRSKLAGDEALAALAAETGLSVVSLRPPTVFGPGVGAYFAQLARCARRGLPLPIGGFANRRSFIFAGNLADATLAAATGAGEGAFVVTDSPPISTAALYARLLAAYGRRGWIPALPQGPVQTAARILLGDRADSLLGSSAFDGSRFKRAFGWEPPVDFDAAVAATVGAA